MCALNPTYNLLLENHFQEPLPSHRMELGWILPLMVYGEDDMRRLTLMLEFSTPSNRHPTLTTSHRHHENIKRCAYEQRVREVKHSSFTPLMMSLTGDLGPAATTCYRRLASLLALKEDRPYSTVMSSEDLFTASFLNNVYQRRAFNLWSCRQIMQTCTPPINQLGGTGVIATNKLRQPKIT